jgi:uncharacterized protein YndB with AHSA1/START domain
MKWVLRLVGAVTLAALFLLGIGVLLPAGYRVERSVEIAAPPGRVYALIASPRQWPRWSAWIRRDREIVIDYDGPESGIGARSSWHSRSIGSGSIEFTDAVADRRISYALSMSNLGFRSRGDLTIDPAGAHVRVNWSHYGDFGTNPASRWFGPFMDRIVGPDFEAGLLNLKAILEGG